MYKREDRKNLEIIISVNSAFSRLFVKIINCRINCRKVQSTLLAKIRMVLVLVVDMDRLDVLDSSVYNEKENNNGKGNIYIFY